MTTIMDVSVIVRLCLSNVYQRIDWEAEVDMGEAGEEESLKNGWSKEDVLCQPKWSVGVNQIANRLIIIIIMVIFKCYFSEEHIALSIKK